MGVYGGSGKSSPSNLSRLLDVVSRGQYASAEGVRRLAKGKGAGGFASGFASGLAGKSKTSYSTVLGEHGVKGPLGAIGGFIGDVALDPTTYLTLGVGKVAEEVGVQAGRRLSVKLAGREVLKTGVPFTAASALKKGATAGGKRVLASKAGKQIAKTTRTEGIGGKLAEGGAKLKDELNKTFNTGAGLTPEIRALQQKTHGFESMKVAEDAHKLKAVFDGTTKAHREMLGRHLEAGSLNGLSNEDRDLVLYAAKIIGKKNLRSKNPAKLVWPVKAEDIAVTASNHLIKTGRKEAQSKFLKEAERLHGAEIKASPELQRALNMTSRMFNDNDKLSGYFVRHFDKIQSLWKTQATVLNPGHHVRNLMGDTYMNWIAGVRSTKSYHKAEKLVREGVDGGEKILIHNKEYTKDDLLKMYRDLGLKSGYIQSEGLFGNPSRFKSVGRFMDHVASGSDKREDFTRLAHFVDVLTKQTKAGKTIEQAGEEAARRIRKYNFDFADLTERERKYMKRLVPFYTYTRKALPRHLEIMFTKPGKIASVGKAGSAVSRLLGLPEKGTDEPLPGLTNALPSWYRDTFNIGIGNNKIVSPSLPLDLLGQFGKSPGGIGKEILGRSSPLIKTPIELSTKRTLDTGFAVKGPADYLVKQLSYPKNIRDYFDKGNKQDHLINVGGQKVDERKINWLTGAGVHRINPPPSKKKGSRRKKHKVYGS